MNGLNGENITKKSHNPAEFIPGRNFSPTGWSDHGCHISSMDNYGTECSCNHLTHFAVLVQFDANAGGSNSLLTRVRPIANMFILICCRFVFRNYIEIGPEHARLSSARAQYGNLP